MRSFGTKKALVSSTELNVETPQLTEDNDGERSGALTSVLPKSSKATIGGDTAENFVLDDARAHSYLPWCSTIVLTANDGEWLELRCPDCGGNASSRSGSLLSGVGAMLMHLTLSHDRDSIPMAQVFELCKHREVQMPEIRAICERKGAGMPYVEVVPVETKHLEAPRKRKAADTTETPEKPWRWTRNQSNFVAAVPCVVKHPDGTWYIIACPVCKGNTGSNQRRSYFQGAKGLQDHLRHGHGEDINGVTVADFIEWCQVRKLTAREYEKIKRGSRDAIKIDMVIASNTAKPPTKAEKSARGQAALLKDLLGTTKPKGDMSLPKTEGYGRGERPHSTARYEVSDSEYIDSDTAGTQASKRRKVERKSKQTAFAANWELDQDDEEPVPRPKEEPGDRDTIDEPRSTSVTTAARKRSAEADPEGLRIHGYAKQHSRLSVDDLLAEMHGRDKAE